MDYIRELKERFFGYTMFFNGRYMDALLTSYGTMLTGVPRENMRFLFAPDNARLDAAAMGEMCNGLITDSYITFMLRDVQETVSGSQGIKRRPNDIMVLEMRETQAASWKPSAVIALERGECELLPYNRSWAVKLLCARSGVGSVPGGGSLLLRFTIAMAVHRRHEYLLLEAAGRSTGLVCYYSRFGFRTNDRISNHRAKRIDDSPECFDSVENTPMVLDLTLWADRIAVLLSKDALPELPLCESIRNMLATNAIASSSKKRRRAEPAPVLNEKAARFLGDALANKKQFRDQDWIFSENDQLYTTQSLVENDVRYRRTLRKTPDVKYT